MASKILMEQIIATLMQVRRATIPPGTPWSLITQSMKLRDSFYPILPGGSKNIRLMDSDLMLLLQFFTNIMVLITDSREATKSILESSVTLKVSLTSCLQTP